MLYPEAVEPDTLELLNSLMKKDYLKDFFLVGGTALALQIGHRKSVDLDMFTTNDFDSELVLAKLIEDYNPTILLKLPQTLICNINQIKVDFVRFRYPIIRPIINTDGIRLLEIDDLAPMKMDAITGRGSKKDFYDLFFLFQRYKLTTLLDLYKEKYSHQTVFHVVRSMSYLKDAENDPDPIVFDESITWPKVKKAISKNIQNL
jgi:hypothetical protein